MITPPSAENQSQTQPAAVVEPGFEVAAQVFWEKNRSLILMLCGAALLAIIGAHHAPYAASASVACGSPWTRWIADGDDFFRPEVRRILRNAVEWTAPKA